MRTFDVAIIGGGPAGLSAAFYAGRLNLSTLLIERHQFGGKITEAPMIENYPGFPEGISGPKLTEKLLAQVLRWNVQTWRGEVVELLLNQGNKLIRASNEDFSARTLVIAGGTEYKRLDVPGEDDLIGKGLSFCALCDGPSFAGKPVAVIGAGDGGLSQVLHLLQFSDKIIVIEKFPQPTASPVLLKRARSDPRISFILSTTVGRVEKMEEGILLRLENIAENTRSEIVVGGAVISVGLVPNTSYLKDTLLLDERGGWIIADLEMRTCVPGVFSAGDIRAGSPRQAIAAVADGVTAVISAFRFLKGD